MSERKGGYYKDRCGLWHYHSYQNTFLIEEAIEDALERRPKEPAWFWFNQLFTPIYPDDTKETLQARWKGLVGGETFTRHDALRKTLLNFIPEKARLGEGRFSVIRVSDDYGMVIVVTPEDTDPQNPKDARFYLHHDIKWKEGEPFFREASFREVLGFFSGHADGMGWGNHPEQPFDTLDAVEKWATEMTKSPV